jgi:hypothetical protein
MTVKKELERKVDQLIDGLHLASEGSGPLLQRDYWGVIRESRLSPKEIAQRLAEDFCSFAPEDLVRFKQVGEPERALQEGDELEVTIRMAGTFGVRVVHRDSNSVTLGTLKGHPEAGRITFGAYRNDAGDVIFHIRSRARSSSRVRYAGFITAGEPMQTNTWTDFVDRLAHTVGEGVVGVIHADKEEMEDEPDDPETACSPTFKAVGE